jgi:carbon monoxide dehydrogenase subunit G
VDLERTTTVGMGADAAFAVLADPARVPEYVPVVTLVESVVEDGDAPAAIAAGGGETRFFVDAGARRIEWGEEGASYSGSMTVAPGTASTSQLTVRLHVRDDADRAKVEEVMDQALRGLRRMLSGR